MTQPPYVLLSSGQSNMARITPGIPWSPPSNLRVWRYNVTRHEEGAGEGFHIPSDDVGSYANFYAACIARDNPDQVVYVINISMGGINLRQWLPDAAPINMMNAIEKNVAAALSHIDGATAVSEVLWWGHESDAVPTADTSLDRFVDDFLTVIARLDSNLWCANQPPIRFHRIHPDCNRLAAHINHALETLVLTDTARFSLSDTTKFTYTDRIHLDPDQKEAAAEYVYSTPSCDLSKNRLEVRPNLLMNGDFSDFKVGFEPWWVKARVQKLETVKKLEIVNGVVQLRADAGMAQVITNAKLSKQVLTISMENVVSDLQVRIGKRVATVRAGPGRRQACFARDNRLGRDVLVFIVAADNGYATFSHAKLELGGAATDYTHRVAGIADRLIQRWWKVKHSVRLYLHG